MSQYSRSRYMTNFLPVTMQELLETGVSQPEFV